MKPTATKNPFNSIVIVAALGYFVDIYDLILFGIVREPSLRAIGIPDEQSLSVGHYLLNWQMVGMLAGGIVWGILGDKKGRLSTLFATIILYSLANIANGFVQNIEQYAALRFIAGFGLAGELGVGITLVAEVMTQESRGYGTMVVSGVGIAGAAIGYAVTKYFDWQWAYWVGGIMGLLLLFLRVMAYESGMFEKTKHENIKRGEFLSLFTAKSKFFKYLNCILIGVPVWYVIGVLVFSSPEFAKKVFHVQGNVEAGKSLMYHYIGASLGSFVWGILSQWMKSRRKSLMVSLLTLTTLIAAFFFAFDNATANLFYIFMAIFGVAMGYWSVFITTASEQFGTNLRATVTTTVPNIVRGSTVLLTLLFQFIKGSFADESSGLLFAGIIVGVFVMGFSLLALSQLEETYHKDLDYFED